MKRILAICSCIFMVFTGCYNNNINNIEELEITSEPDIPTTNSHIEKKDDLTQKNNQLLMYTLMIF